MVKHGGRGYNPAVGKLRLLCGTAALVAGVLLTLLLAPAFAQELEQEAQSQPGASEFPRLKRNPSQKLKDTADSPAVSGTGAGADSADGASGSEVSLTLSGGSVVGKVRGQGKARVEAEVKNLGGRELKGIRIAAFYDSADRLPAPDADWHVHEFVFEPPLKPAASTTLRFSDENAAEYILLEVRHVVYGRGISYQGRGLKLRDPLVDQDGELYVSTRDLLEAIGGKLGYDSKTGYVSLEREGVSLQIKKDRYGAKLNGESVDLKHLPLEIENRSYVCAEEIARLLGLSPAWDAGTEHLDLGS